MKNYSLNHPSVRAIRTTDPERYERITNRAYLPHLIGLGVSLTSTFLVTLFAPVLTFYGYPIPFVLVLPFMGAVVWYANKIMGVYEAEIRNEK
jgi:hypothetical protein